jgi:hypothetical protein
MCDWGVTSGTAKVYESRVDASIPVAMAEEEAKHEVKGDGGSEGQLRSKAILISLRPSDSGKREEGLTGDEHELKAR